MNSKKKIDYRQEILKLLSNYLSGLTITDISEKINGNRNTVSKYLAILESEDLVYKKEVGAASLYFSAKRKMIPQKQINSFLKGLCYALKLECPNQEEKFKNIGRKILDRFSYTQGDSYKKEIEKIKNASDVNTQLKLFKELYNSFDIFQKPISITIIELYKHRIVYRFSNSEFLNNSDDYILYFYIMSGMTESFIAQQTGGKVSCNVEKINVDKSGENSFVDISLEIL